MLTNVQRLTVHSTTVLCYLALAVKASTLVTCFRFSLTTISVKPQFGKLAQFLIFVHLVLIYIYICLYFHKLVGNFGRYNKTLTCNINETMLRYQPCDHAECCCCCAYNVLYVVLLYLVLMCLVMYLFVFKILRVQCLNISTYYINDAVSDKSKRTEIKLRYHIVLRSSKGTNHS